MPWQGRVVEIQLHARWFRCADHQCPRRIFTERLPETVQPKARRTVRLGESQLAIGFAVGGEPVSRLSDRLAMSVSGDTLLRMIRGRVRAAASAACGRHGRLGLAQGTALRDDHLRSGAQPRAGSVAGSKCRHGRIMAGTLSWHRDHRSRSCRRLC
ncbi:hypothetical protein [Mesorhizobium sp. M0189]|uniref:hypothetical protein n=1 Tax=Mesorhizobium sp. M0189 TaxID=2956909 RepID=UPI003336FEDB